MKKKDKKMLKKMLIFIPTILMLVSIIARYVYDVSFDSPYYILFESIYNIGIISLIVVALYIAYDY